VKLKDLPATTLNAEQVAEFFVGVVKAHLPREEGFLLELLSERFLPV